MTRQYELFGGEPPAQRHSPTSIAAATAIKPRIGPIHHRIITYLEWQRDAGATDEEMQIRIPMGANTQRPRRRELELMGIIVDSGHVRLARSGRAAVVWKLT